MRSRHGSDNIQSADILRQRETYRHPVLENCQEEVGVAQNGLRRRPGSLKFVLRLRLLAAEDVLGADCDVVARMIDVKLPGGTLRGENLSCAQCGAKLDAFQDVRAPDVSKTVFLYR